MHGLRRTRRPLYALLAGALTLAGLSATTASAASTTRVVVTSSTSGAAARSVRAAGGTVVDALPLLDAVIADLPAGARPLGVTVVADRPLTVTATEDAGDAGESADALRASLGATDPNAGAGVTVAVVDTGVADVPELADAVLRHIDVTGTGPGDGYGHGTFIAGLVAGATTGVARRASVLDVRVANDDGSTSLSLVLRGLQRVADLAASARVRVVNLALSSESPLPWQIDPLTRALDALWRRGLTVVVPAGNDGPEDRTISSPGDDPTLLTVGAVDTAATGDRADDVVPDWSSRGPADQGVAKPDLAAPGSHLVSVRAPGSVIDVTHPESRVGASYFRGSGTSMSTAVTSGAVAALLARRPGLAPDAVKGLLTATAYDADGLSDPDAAGAGGLDLAAAIDGRVPATRRAHSLSGTDLAAWTAFVAAWMARDYSAAARSWALLSPAARSWAARSWADAVWARAGSWSDAEWAARSWAARSWAARSWADEEWLARSWAARSWADESRLARSWSARSWSARSWSARSWSARSWSARSWSADEWSARSWSARSWTARTWA